MKELMLLRHAKAVSEHAAGDFARPLSTRGIEQMQQVAAALQAKGWYPDFTLVSPAKRTLQTADILEKNTQVLHAITDPTLYLATDDQICAAIAGAPDDAERLLVIGHNPGISDLAAQLSHDAYARPLPTAGFVICPIDVDHWHRIVKALG